MKISMENFMENVNGKIFGVRKAPMNTFVARSGL